MKIAILGGTGSIGKGLALRWSGKHEIVVCSCDPDKAMKAAGECYTLLSDKGRFCTGISGSMNEMGIKYVDVVVLSVPYQGIVPLLKDLTPYFSNQIVISLVVPMKKNRWYEYAPPKHGSAAFEIQEIETGEHRDRS